MSKARFLSTFPPKLSHYEALRLPRNANRQQIKARFYELSKKHHPDAPGGSSEKFHKINDAYAVLSDESKRRQYDYEHSSTPATSSGPSIYTGRTSGGPHRAWSRPSPSQSAYHYGGRKVPPSFGSASNHPNMRKAGSTGPMGDYPFGHGHMKPRRPRNAASADQDATGEGVWRFVVVGMVLVVIVIAGGGVTASAESDEEDLLP